MSLPFVSYLSTFLNVYSLDVNKEFMNEVERNKSLQDHIQKTQKVGNSNLIEFVRSKMTDVSKTIQFQDMQRWMDKLSLL